MGAVQAVGVMTSGSTAAAESVSLAREIERLSISDSDAAAAGLSRLGALVRSACAVEPTAGRPAVPVGRLNVQLERLDEQFDDLEGRLRTGHVKGVAGLERRVRQILVTAGLPMPIEAPDVAPNR